MSDAVQEMNPDEAPASPGCEWADLRLAREARGLSIGQVSDQLKLTPRQLDAIERGDLSILPGATFARGFVRNYARFLQLDPTPFLGLIDASEGRVPAASISVQMNSPSLGRMPTPGDSRFSALPAALLVLLLACVLGLGWHYKWFEASEEAALLEENAQLVEGVVVEDSEPIPAAIEQSAVVSVSAPAIASASAPVQATVSAPESASVPVAPVAPVAQSAAVVPQASAPSVARASAPAAAQSGAARTQPASGVSAPAAKQSLPAPTPAVSGLPRIVLGFEGESWVEVRDASDKVVFARLSQAGVVQEVQGAAPFVLVIGNAPKVKLTWKGKVVDLGPHTKGDVARLTVQ